MTEAQHNANEETLDTMEGLDETLDDLADLPERKPFPAGAYVANVVVKRNAKKAGQYIVEMTHVETMELANADATSPVPGDQSTMFINTKDKEGKPVEFGQGQIKKILSTFAELAGSRSIGDILQVTASGVQCAIVVAVRVDKAGVYDDQQDLKSIELV